MFGGVVGTVPEDNSQQRRMIYVGVFTGLVAVFALTRGVEWHSDAYLHTILETIATLLALMVGVVAWVRYHSRPSNLDLFLSVSFLGTGLLDCYHAVVTAPWLGAYFASAAGSLIPWSWMASRLFLAVMMVLTWYAVGREDRRGQAGLIGAGRVVWATGSILLASFIFFAFVPLPPAYFQSFGPIGRPQEILVAIFFAVALIGNLRNGRWRTEVIDHWLILCLLINVAGELLFMSTSHHMFDFEFDLAHYLKKVSYVCVLTGLLLNMLALYRRADLTGQLKQLVMEKEKSAELLSTALNRAEAANKAKSMFLANMSHEIRTPLNAVIGLAQLLLRHNHNPDTLSSLQKINRAGEHLLGLVNDLLDISKIENGKVELDHVDFNLMQMLKSCITTVEDQAQFKKLRLMSTVPPDVPLWVNGDPGRLRQCVLNYLNNAIKFTQEGRIEVHLSVESRPQGWLIRIDVTDTGIGIPDTVLNRLFSSFEQADSSTTRLYGGTGLGLSIVSKLAHLMGGQVGCRSVVGQGSTFWFTACVQHPTQVHISWEEQESETYEPRLKQDFAHSRILLVEDNQVNQQVVMGLLEDVDMDVDLADNGQIAVEMIQNRHYDLILMDMQMPVMDGVTAVQIIRRMPLVQNIPVIALTANAFAEDKRVCLEAGMNDHLGKPIQPEILYGTLIRHLSNARSSLNS